MWLRAEECPWDMWTCAYAADGGHLEVLKWLRDKGCPSKKAVCNAAAGGGPLEVMMWLRASEIQTFRV